MRLKPAPSCDCLASNRWPPLLALTAALALYGCHDVSQLEVCAEIDCGPGECVWEEGTGRFCSCPDGFHDEGPHCIADGTDGDLDADADLDTDDDGCEATEELCNGEDDDCDGEIDEDYDCVSGETSACMTTCGTEGIRTCEVACQWSEYCEPPPESCNGVDDDCDGEVPRAEQDLDDDGLRPCKEDCNDHDGSVGRCNCLAVGGGGYQIRVYRLDGLGGLSLIWSSDEVSTTRSLAWVDWDSDGDQDLAAANESDRSRIYRRTETGLELAWESDHIDDTMSMAWADWDGDGDMDPVFGNSFQPDRLFQNTDGVLDEVWTFGESDITFSVAWADLDGDGDLDLVEGNIRSIVVYENNLGEFVEGWSTVDHEDITTLAVAQLESDVHPRLFVGTVTGLLSYRREGDAYMLASTNAEVIWSQTLALADFDLDGDLDVAAATSHEQADRLLENEGDLFTQTWVAPVVEDSFGAA